MMNKTQLIEAIAISADLTLAKSDKVLNSLLETMIDALRQGNTLNLVGFGNFGVKTRAARTGRNPQTGKAIPIPETTVPYFKPGKLLKSAVAIDTSSASKKPVETNHVKTKAVA